MCSPSLLSWARDRKGPCNRSLRPWVSCPANTGSVRSAAAHPVSFLDHVAHIDVPSRWLDAPRRQHALLVDFRRQHRRAMGRARFLVFYLICGIVAGLAHIAFSGGRPSRASVRRRNQRRARRLPVAVPREKRARPDARRHRLGPCYRRARFLDRDRAVQPGRIHCETSEGGGVAYMAHIGGFVAGLVLVKIFTAGRRLAVA